MKNKTLILFSCLFILVIVVIVSIIYKKSLMNKNNSQSFSSTNQSSSQTPSNTGSQNGINQLPEGLSQETVTIKTEKGVIRYKFYSKDAPQTVARIKQLISQGFYNGLTFHRVVPDFVIQGGDPLGNGTGGSGMRLKAEFNSRQHHAGTVAMARSQDPNSADSQFYICLGTLPHLDRSYTVFGQVVEGMDVVQKIQIGDKMLDVSITE